MLGVVHGKEGVDMTCHRIRQVECLNTMNHAHLVETQKNASHTKRVGAQANLSSSSDKPGQIVVRKHTKITVMTHRVLKAGQRNKRVV